MNTEQLPQILFLIDRFSEPLVFRHIFSPKLCVFVIN